MMFEDTLTALAQNVQIDPKARIGRLRPGKRLKQQVYGRAPLQAVKLGADMRQAARLGGDVIGFDQTLKSVQNLADRFHGLGRRVHADDGISAAEQQAINGGQEYPAKIIGRVIGLDPNPQDAGLAHGIATARDVADFAGRHNQVFIAHQLGDRRGDLRGNGPVERTQTSTILILVQHILAELADRQMGKRTERLLVIGLKNQTTHFVLGRLYEGICYDIRQRNISQGQLGRHPFLLGGGGNPGQAVARLVFIGLGKDFTQVGKRKTPAANGSGVAHIADSPKRIVRNRREFVNTETELKAMADAATMGSSRMPKNG